MADIVRIILNIVAGGVLIACGSLFMSGAFEAGAHKKAFSASRRFVTPGGAFFASTLITACVQSSSVVTVLTVSMANAGLLGLPAAMAAVYGANIGTTVTSQIMSLDISSFGIYALPAGIAAYVFFRAANIPLGVPKAVTGLGMLFAGLSILKASASLIKGSGYVMNFINYYSENTLWCVFFGFATTALVHSSSATVGVTIAMFSGGVIGFKEAVLITLGDNIGTCVTAQMAAAAGSAPGRRVAWGNTFYNIACALLALVFIDAFTKAVLLITHVLGQGEGNLVANAHTLLNVLGALIFLPLNEGYCRLLEKLSNEEY